MGLGWLVSCQRGVVPHLSHVCVNCQVGQDGTSETRPEIDSLPSVMLQSRQGYDRSDM